MKHRRRVLLVDDHDLAVRAGWPPAAIRSELPLPPGAETTMDGSVAC